MSIFNWGEISRTLANSRNSVTEKGRGHKKHKSAINKLLEFEKQWNKEYKFKKT
jgi:hypothetical protein